MGTTKKKSKTAKRTTGNPRAPFKLAQDWEEQAHWMFPSKDDQVRAEVRSNIEGDLDLSIYCGTWATLEDAQRVAGFLLALLLDEHGYSRELEEFDEELLDIFEDVASTPKIVSIDRDLVELSTEQAKQLYERFDDGGGSGTKKKKGKKKGKKS